LFGHRSGLSVSFLKSYDPPGSGFDTVNYSGELNADATEIAGIWSIGNVFGKRGEAFLNDASEPANLLINRYFLIHTCIVREQSCFAK